MPGDWATFNSPTHPGVRCRKKFVPGNVVRYAGSTFCGAQLHERRLNPEDTLVHHSDRGVQYVSIRYTERLAEAGIEPSVGSRGDSYDNALAESIIGLYKTEVIRRRGPWRGLEDVEFATLEWVHWYNTQRLLEPIGNVSPVEYEMNYYRSQEGSLEMARLN